jgi:hypothetical protein
MKVCKAAKRHQKKQVFKQVQVMTAEEVSVRYSKEIAKASAYVKERQRQISEYRANNKFSFREPADGILAGSRTK